MKKYIVALLWTLIPPIFVIATTPLSQLPEHIGHIVLFALVGMFMGWYLLRKELKEKRPIRRTGRFLPSFATITFLILISFVAIYSLPCPYMFSPHAQTMIDHPCSQQTITCTSQVAFIPIGADIQQIAQITPDTYYVIITNLPHNKAPPFS